MTYATAEEIISFSMLDKEQLKFETDSDFETYVESLIPLAEGIIEDHCRVPRSFFEAEGYTQTNGLYDYRETWIQLKYRPGISVSKVEVDTSAYGDSASWTELAAQTGYVFAADRALLKIVGDVRPQAMLQTVRVTYTAGYAATPQAVKGVLMQLVSNMMHELLRRRLTPVVRVSDYAIRLVVPRAFTRELQLRLMPYVHYEVGVG